MSFEITNIDNDLDFIIFKKEKITPALAIKWKWRILNEYPDELKQLVRAWASEKDLPEISYNDISLERILKSTPFNFLDAVDLLYVLQKDPVTGYEIFSKSVVRDAGRRR